jgi:hypothetical protein
MMAAAAGALVLTGPAQATEIIDDTGQGDMLNDFSALEHPDLDVVTARGTYNSTTLFLSSTQMGPVGLSGDNLFVWGIDRGQGQDTILAHREGQPSLGNGVKFDAFILVDSTGTQDGLFLVTYDADHQVSSLTRNTLQRSWVTIDGNTLSLAIPLAEIFTTGFDVSQYGLNLWTRSGDASTTAFIVDFAPNGLEQGGEPGRSPLFNPSLAVPEPTTWALMIMGFGLAGASLRRRRTAALAA